MAAIYYSGAILMNFYMHTLYMEIIDCSKFGYNFLTNNENRPIVLMAAIRYVSEPDCSNLFTITQQ